MFEDLGGEAEETEEAVLPEEEPAEEGENPTGAFDAQADIALDTTLPMAERRAALKEAIMACMGGSYESEEAETGEGSSLAAIFGS